ncbi:hypothetical protein PENSPDRAFT_648029 [Peniophora sp. CONT]|nr:hypothetical protein PENSPDRAFT_648029 [Peniophora sp. CONT]
MPSSPSKIGHLPVEILSCVFCHLSSSAKPLEEDLHAPAPPWGPVLHVCRWWRQVAIESKDLWRIIPLGHAEWAKMALRLSHPRTIVISMIPTSSHQHSNGSTRLQSVAAMVLVEAHRARMIHLLIASPNGQSQDHRLLEALRDVAPDELVDLSLWGYTNYYSAMKLQGMIFKHKPVKLQHLSINSCQLLLRQPHIFSSQMTTLRITSCFLTSAYTLTMHLRDIQSLLHLEYLDVSIYSPPVMPWEPHTAVELDVPRILLPRLKAFKLTSDFELIRSYLACIDVPLSCRLILSSDLIDMVLSQSAVKESMLGLAQLLAHRLTMAIGTHQMALEISLSGAEYYSLPESRGSFRINVKDRLPTRPLAPSGETSCSFCCMLDTNHDASITGLLGIVPRDLPIPVITIGPGLDQSDWNTLLPFHSRVQELILTNPKCASVFPLAHRQLHSEEMPLLKSITIQYQYDGILTSEDNESSFPLVEALVRNASLEKALSVTIEIWGRWPTSEQQAILQSYSAVCFRKLGLQERMALARARIQINETVADSDES